MPTVPKNWADSHFRTAPAVRPAPKRSLMALAGGLLMAGVGLCLLCAGGVVVADYTGLAPIGLFPKPLPEREATAVKRRAPAPAPAPVAAQPTPEPAVMDEPAPTFLAIAKPEEPTATQMPDRRAADHVAHLAAGIALMARESDAAGVEIERQRSVLSMRKRGERPKPWTSAESMDEIAWFVQLNPQLSTAEKWKLQRSYDGFAADCTNAKRRIAELSSKQASLGVRIDKAKAEAASLSVQ